MLEKKNGGKTWQIHDVLTWHDIILQETVFVKSLSGGALAKFIKSSANSSLLETSKGICTSVWTKTS